MANIIQGSTPDNKFELPFAQSLVENISITYKQKGEIVFKKAGDDVKIEGGYAIVTLTQEETLSLIEEDIVEVQLKVKTTNGKVIPSSKLYVGVYEVLDKEVM